MAANGVGVPTKIVLSGAGLTHIVGNEYSAQLAVNATLVLTATPKDIAGNDVSDTGSITWVSYNAAPTGQPGKVATVSAGTVTAVAVGQAVIEASYPAFDLDGANAIGNGKVYAQVTVQVVPA